MERVLWVVDWMVVRALGLMIMWGCGDASVAMVVVVSVPYVAAQEREGESEGDSETEPVRDGI